MITLMMMVVPRVLIGGLVLQSPRELHDGRNSNTSSREHFPRGKGGSLADQDHTKTLGHYIITLSKNPWLEIRKPLCSSHDERTCPPSGKTEGGGRRENSEILIPLSSDVEQSNSHNSNSRIVIRRRTHREFKV